MSYQRDLTLIRRLSLAYWQKEAQYRLGAVMWIFNGFLSPLILMAVWLVVSGNNQISLSSNQIISYYLMTTIVVRLTQTWSAEDTSDSIKSGRFSTYLIKPFSFLHERLAKDQALRLIRLLSLLPFFVICLVIFSEKLTYIITLPNLILFAMAIILGYVVNFVISIFVGIIAFWLEEAYGTFLLLMLVTELFSGMLIPLNLMPPALAKITVLLPFYSLIGLPTDIITGSITLKFALSYMFVSGLWLIILSLGFKFVYRRAVRSFTAVGI